MNVRDVLARAGITQDMIDQHHGTDQEDEQGDLRERLALAGRLAQNLSPQDQDRLAAVLRGEVPA